MLVYSKKYNYYIKYHAKSGCTSFRQLFLFLHKDELNEHEKSRLQDWHNINDLFVNYKGVKPVFCINTVRDPYTRVVSMFTNKMCGGPRHNILNKKIKLEKHTFYHFVKYLYDYNKKHSKIDIDIHVYPQIVNYNKNDKIIKLENYKDDVIRAYDNEYTRDLLPKINEFLSRDTFINKSNRGDSTEFIGYNEYHKDYTGPWPDYKYFYNDEIRNMVYEMYYSDFILFGYEKN